MYTRGCHFDNFVFQSGFNFVNLMCQVVEKCNILLIFTVGMSKLKNWDQFRKGWGPVLLTPSNLYSLFTYFFFVKFSSKPLLKIRTANAFSQCPRTDLNKRSLPRPRTTTAWKLIPHRSKISKNWNPTRWVPLHRFFKNWFLLMRKQLYINYIQTHFT